MTKLLLPPSTTLLLASRLYLGGGLGLAILEALHVSDLHHRHKH